MAWPRSVAIWFLVLGLAAAGGAFVYWGLQPATVGRGLEMVTDFGNRARGFVVEAGESGLKQQDLRDIGFACGRGAVHYVEHPGDMFILGSRAYVRGPAGDVRTAEVVINTESALGLAPDAPAAAMLRLPRGNPVALRDLLDDIGAGREGPTAVLGIGSFAAVSGEPDEGRPPNRFAAWWESRFGEPPAPTGLVFLAFRTGPENGAWRVCGLTTAEVPVGGAVEAPEEIAARALAAGLRAPVSLSVSSTATELALAVYDLEAIVPAADFVEPPLVEIGAVDPTIALDIRYAGTDNFAGRAVYPAPRAYLVLPEAERLGRVNARLREQGFRLKVWDAYRPLSDHARLRELAPDKRFWADPARGSNHSRGAAVDCTLETLDGREVEMPTGFDDFTHRAHRNYEGVSEAARRHRQILEEAMVAEGFRPLQLEWWHFDSPCWQDYPLRDIPLAAVP